MVCNLGGELSVTLHPPVECRGGVCGGPQKILYPPAPGVVVPLEPLCRNLPDCAVGRYLQVGQQLRQQGCALNYDGPWKGLQIRQDQRPFLPIQLEDVGDLNVDRRQRDTPMASAPRPYHHKRILGFLR